MTLLAAIVLVGATAANTDDVIDMQGSDVTPVPRVSSDAAGQGHARMSLLSRGLFNIHTDNPSREAYQTWHLAALRVDQAMSATTRAMAEATLRWGLWATPAPRAQWAAEVGVREAFVQTEVAALRLRLRGGALQFAWGKNDWGAPANQLNPLDVRFDPTVAFVEPRAVRLPVLALHGVWTPLEDISLEVVWQPVFVAHRAFVFGHDTAPADTGALPALMPFIARGASMVDPAVRDALLTAAPGTRVPSYGPASSSAAVRASWHVAGWDMATTAYYGWQRTPRLRFDPVVQSVLGGNASAASLAIVQQRILAGVPLVDVTYARHGVVAFEAEGTAGPFVLRLDAGIDSGQLVYTRSLAFLERPAGRLVAAAEYLQGPWSFVSIGGYVNDVIVPRATPPLAAIESPSATGDRVHVLNGGIMAAVRYAWQAVDLEARAFAAYDITLGDYVGWAQLSYTPWDAHSFSLGAVCVDGPSGTIVSGWRDNDLIFVQYQAAF